MAKTSPTQRTLAAMKAKGYRCAIVEKFNRFAGPFGIRQDMFGIIDIVALGGERGVIGIQSTGQDFAGHLNAMMGEKAQDCIDWLSTRGAVLELWGWRKLRKEGGKKGMRWEARVKVFTLEDFKSFAPVRRRVKK